MSQLFSGVRTAWHPMLVKLLELELPEGYRLTPELQLSREPLRVDIVVVEQVGTAAGGTGRLRSIIDHLGRHTLIHFKGPTDDLDGKDALQLLSYGCLYMGLADLEDPAEVTLMTVSDRVSGPFAAQVKRLRGKCLSQLRAGMHQGRLGPFRLHAVETRVVADEPSEQLLYVFSRRFLDDPRRLLGLTARERLVYMYLYQQVEQLKERLGEMALKDIVLLEEKQDEVWAELLSRLPAEVRLRGLAPEEILSRFGAEERMRGLAPEEILSRFGAEERMRGLAPEELLRGLTAEERKRLRELLDKGRSQ